MKAITLTQPWATLVAISAKKIETRSWKTDYRGPLAIHAAKDFPKEARELCLTEPFRTVLKTRAKVNIIWDMAYKISDFPLGKVIATCELVNCVRIPSETTLFKRLSILDDRYSSVGDFFPDFVTLPPSEPELSFGLYTPTRFAWFLSNTKSLPEPIPAKGALGLWEWQPS